MAGEVVVGPTSRGNGLRFRYTTKELTWTPTKPQKCYEWLLFYILFWGPGGVGGELAYQQGRHGLQLALPKPLGGSKK